MLNLRKKQLSFLTSNDSNLDEQVLKSEVMNTKPFRSTQYRLVNCGSPNFTVQRSFS